AAHCVYVRPPRGASQRPSPPSWSVLMQDRPDALSIERQEFNEQLMRSVDRAIGFVYAHWLATINVLGAVFVGLPVLAPLLMAAGVRQPALWIYSVYSAVCHQLPSHSYFLLGYEVCICQRCIAISGTATLSGVVFAFFRRRVPPAPWQVFVLACLPIAIDGFTQ